MHMRACENLYSEQLFFFFSSDGYCWKRTVNVPAKPHQPLDFKFPKHSFGKKNVVEMSFSLAGLLSGPSYTTMRPKMLHFAMLNGIPL